MFEALSKTLWRGYDITKHIAITSVRTTASIGKSALTLTGGLFNSDEFKYAYGQTIKGATTMWTFPMTVLGMLNDPDGRKIIGHAFEYSVVYYLLPVCAYHMTVGDSAPYLVDICANALFLRSAINAYAMDVVINTNTAIVQNPQQTLDCSEKGCPDERIQHAKLMEPMYDISKILFAKLIARIPYVGWGLGTFGLKPLAWGQGIAGLNSTEMCDIHKAQHQSQHNFAHFGIGAMALLWLSFVTNQYFGLQAITGVESIWIDDAIFHLLYPLMVYHMYRQDTGSFQNAPGRDIFKTVRQATDDTFQFVKDDIIARIVIPREDLTLIKRLNNIWRSGPLKAVRAVTLYPSINRNPYTLVRDVRPVKWLVQLKAETIKAKLSLAETAVIHNRLATMVVTGLGYLQGNKEQAQNDAMLINKLAAQPNFTLDLLDFVDDLIKHAQDPNHIRRFRWDLKQGIIHTEEYLDFVRTQPSADQSRLLALRRNQLGKEHAIERLPTEVAVPKPRPKTSANIEDLRNRFAALHPDQDKEAELDISEFKLLEIGPNTLTSADSPTQSSSADNDAEAIVLLEDYNPEDALTDSPSPFLWRKPPSSPYLEPSEQALNLSALRRRMAQISGDPDSQEIDALSNSFSKMDTSDDEADEDPVADLRRRIKNIHLTTS